MIAQRIIAYVNALAANLGREHRGEIRLEPGGTGVADQLYVGRVDASGVMEWAQLTDQSGGGGGGLSAVSDTASINLTDTAGTLTADVIFGTTAGTVAAGDHTHDIAVQTPGCTWGDGVNTDSITTGTVGYVRVPYAGTIGEWHLIANASCSCTIDVWVATGSLPLVANSITGGSDPALTTATTATGNVTGWTDTTLASGDILGFSLDALTGTPSAITLTLKVA